jgi:ribose/xylose/arabinose/galactoside ABC-type transport system permease subunit
MLGVVKNGLNLLGASENYKQLATGLILILALSISSLREILKKENA